jgi:hypothetical protein
MSALTYDESLAALLPYVGTEIRVQFTHRHRILAAFRGTLLHGLEGMADEGEDTITLVIDQVASEPAVVLIYRELFATGWKHPTERDGITLAYADEFQVQIVPTI